MIKIAKLIPGGQALGTAADGRKIFFWNALPGEIVTDYEVTKQKSHYSEAIATSISQPSPHRLAPKDPCYLSTSPWQILDFTYENYQKSLLVTEVFRQHGLEIAPPPVVTDGQEYFYRNKMEYSLYWNKDTEQIDLAFHARGSHRKLPITKSSLEHPEIFARAQAIVADLNFRHEEARRYQSLILRSSATGEISGGLYENHRPHPHFSPLTDQILGHTYQYSPNGFFQINLPVYELALQEIKKHIATTDILDLYSGVGTIGLSVASDHNLTLVENNPFAFGELRENLASFTPSLQPTTDSNSLQISTPTSIISAYLTKSEEALDFITSTTTVILDPPRAGCDPALIARLAEVQPPTIIYLSCNPATQARDLATLLSTSHSPYQFSTIKTFNFFPHTPHIENLVVLSI